MPSCDLSAHSFFFWKMHYQDRKHRNLDAPRPWMRAESSSWDFTTAWPCTPTSSSHPPRRQQDGWRTAELIQDQTWITPEGPEQNKCCVGVMKREDGYLASINTLLETTNADNAMAMVDRETTHCEKRRLASDGVWILICCSLVAANSLQWFWFW